MDLPRASDGSSDIALLLFDFDDVLARYGRDRRCVAYKPNEDASL